MGYGILGIYGKKPAMIAMGVIELSKIGDHYMRLARIYERVAMLVEQYCPDEMAIEAPFFGKTCRVCSSSEGRRASRWPPRYRTRYLSPNTSHEK